MKENILYKKLYRINTLDKFEKYFLMFKDLPASESIINILPDHMYDKYLESLDEFSKELKIKDERNYTSHIRVYNDLFESLSKSYIDVNAYNLYLISEKNESIRNLLKSFRFSPDRFCDKIKYLQNETLTGRLITDSDSPNILTLPKRCRKIFGSRWKSEGGLLMIDFSSLEPRIAKKLTSKENYIDIYEEIKSLLQENLDRSVIKRAVISTLYGSSTGLDNISKEKTEFLIQTCKSFFEYDKLIDIAKNESEHGFRTNFFGRPIWNIKERKDSTVINNYIQSTAVDVALMYFSKLVNSVDVNVCKPLFIIHDAIVFDVKNSYKEQFVNIVNRGYNCKELGYFPLEITNFMET